MFRFLFTLLAAIKEMEVSTESETDSDSVDDSDTESESTNSDGNQMYIVLCGLRHVFQPQKYIQHCQNVSISDFVLLQNLDRTTHLF